MTTDPWEATTTAELIKAGHLEIGDGYRAKNAELADVGIPFARAGNVNAGFAFDGADLFPTEDLDRVGAKRSRVGDCVISMKGTVGRVAYVTPDTPEFVYSPQLSYWRSLSPQRLDPRYLRYWMSGREFRLQVDAVKGSTDMADYVNLREQRRMHITLPPIDVQTRIGSAIGAFDDLIENNRRRVEILEEMARLIYREWFVHFRFPGHEEVELVDSDLGPIPEGWEARDLGSLATWLSGGTPSTKEETYWSGDVPWITSGSLTSFLLDDSPRKLTPAGVAAGSRLVARDALLLVVRGMSLAKEFRHGLADVPVAFGQDCKALLAADDVEPLWLALAVSCMADRIQQMVEFAAHGTGKLSTDRLQALKVAMPPTWLRSRFVEKVRPMRSLMTALRRQNRVLRGARDLLLPRLVSGELDVSELDLELAETG